MQIEEITSHPRRTRGHPWQAVGFALIGIVSVPVTMGYTLEQTTGTIGFYRIAVTQLHWAFAIAIALTIERIRKMFETKTEIRRAARQKLIEKGIEQGIERGIEQGSIQGEHRATERMMSILDRHGVQLPPEAEAEIRKKRQQRTISSGRPIHREMSGGVKTVYAKRAT